MKCLKWLGIVGLLLAINIKVLALSSPKYLSIKKWKQCVSTQTVDTWEQYCLPYKKPTNCPKKSWHQLVKLEVPFPTCQKN